MAMVLNVIILKMFQLYYHYYVNIHPMIIVVLKFIYLFICFWSN
jgi:hypothetical protein